jgi:UDP-galactose transporter B1
MFPYLIGWQGGKTLARATGDIVWLPTKTVIYCAIAVLVGTLSYNDAILEASYPLVIMFKSCSILSVILVGVFFSQVKDGTLKLGVNKLVVGALVSTGICLFNYFSMEDKGEKSTTLLGFCLLVVSLVADGLLPDFQAQMKSVYKPRPVDLMFQINKWTFLLSFFYSLVTMEFWSILSFIRDHPTVLTDICGIAFLNFFVQMFVYYLIQKFKQHVAPFAITIRRIFSVVISIFWFDHQINLWQWMGVGVVFMAAVCDFILERRAKNDEIAKQEEQPDLAKVEVKIETEEVGEYCRIYDDSIADQVKIIGAQHTQEPGCLKIVK